MEHGGHRRKDLALSVIHDFNNACAAEAVPSGPREKLLSDLSQILDGLDALGLSLAAIHVDAAICALKDVPRDLPCS